MQHGCQLARSARHHHAISRSDPRAGARGGDGTARRAEGDGHEGIGRWTASFEVVGAGNNIGLPPAPARLDDGRKLDGVFAMYANTGKFVMGYQDRNVKDLPMRFYEVKFAVARPVTIWTLYNFCRASIGLATAPRK